MRHAYHSPIEHLILATRCSIFCGLSALGFVSLQHGERPGIDRPRNTTRQVQRSVTLSGGGRLHRKLGSAQHPKCGESGTRGVAPSPVHLSSHRLRRSEDNSRSRDHMTECSGLRSSTNRGSSLPCLRTRVVACEWKHEAAARVFPELMCSREKSMGARAPGNSRRLIGRQCPGSGQRR